MDESQNAKSNSSATAIMVSAILNDGTFVETLYDRSREATSFILWKENEEKKEVASIEARKIRFFPYSPKNNLLQHDVVRLPSALGNYASTEALVSAVKSFIQRYCDLDEDTEVVATYYVLFTWIYDAFKEIPYLRVRGEIGSGKTRFLHTVGAICYKGIFASGGTTVSPIFRVLDVFRGTLVLDEADFQESDERGMIVKILNNGHADGFPLLRSETMRNGEYSPTAFHIFGPKIIASRRSFADRALESRCITFDLSARRPRSDIPLNLPESFQNEALALRNQLLLYRFTELFKSHDLLSAARGLQVESRISQVFAPLLSIVHDPAASAAIRIIARESHRRLFAERSLSSEARVLDVVKALADRNEILFLKTIAARFQEKYGDEYRAVITPRWIGRVLRNGLHVLPAKSNGNFLIRVDELPRLRNLFSRYGLMTEDRPSAELGDLDSTNILT